MRVTYTPEAGDRQAWEFVPARIRQSEGEMVEKRFGGPWDKFVAAVMQGDLKARRVLLWHLLRRDHPTVRFEDTPDFYIGELLVEQSYAELLALREKVGKASLPDNERDTVLAAIDVEMTEAMEREGLVDEVAEGKAHSNSAD
jgi:hypothetical protein